MKSTYENPDNVHDFGIDRIATYTLRGKEATNETLNKSVFGQLVKNLHYINPKLLRHKSKKLRMGHMDRGELISSGKALLTKVAHFGIL